MTDPTSPGDRDDLDDRIGAWLDGELPGDEAEAFTARLADDVDLARRVEAVRAVRERLAGAAQAGVPAGFAQRVGAAVAAEAVPADDGADGAASLDAARRRRQQRRRRVAVGSVAAALVAMAVIVPTLEERLVPSGSSDHAEVAGDQAASGGADPGSGDAAETDEDSQPSRLEGAGQPEAGPGSPAGDTGAELSQQARSSASDAPVIVRRRRAASRPAALVAHFSDVPPAQGLLGTSSAGATRLARRSAARLREAEPLDEATPAAACAAEVAADVPGPAVFARVQPVRLDGAPLLAHVVVTGPPGRALSRVVLHVRDPAAGCGAVLVERLR